MHEATIESLACRFRATRPRAGTGMGYAKRAVARMIGYVRGSEAAREWRVRA
jgi:hypothetical protein